MEAAIGVGSDSVAHLEVGAWQALARDGQQFWRGVDARDRGAHACHLSYGSSPHIGLESGASKFVSPLGTLSGYELLDSGLSKSLDPPGSAVPTKLTGARRLTAVRRGSRLEVGHSPYYGADSTGSGRTVTPWTAQPMHVAESNVAGAAIGI